MSMQLQKKISAVTTTACLKPSGKRQNSFTSVPPEIRPGRSWIWNNGKSCSNCPTVTDSSSHRMNVIRKFISKPQTSVSTNSVKSSVVANNSKSTSAPSVSPKVQNNAVPSVSAEPAKSDEGAVSQKTTAEVADNSNDIQAYSQDDGIAIASIDVQSDDRSVYDGTDDNINNSRTVKSSVEDDYSLAGGAQIAYGRYYKLDKDGNPIEAPEENKPIGSIVISAKDADEALSVIRQYSYDEDGEFYTTSSDRLTSMLSVLSVQGIGYSNYTPAYEGEVTFKLVIS